jgi:hypothetical protein
LEITVRLKNSIKLIYKEINVGTGFGRSGETHTTMQTIVSTLSTRIFKAGQIMQWQPTDFLDKKQLSR